MLTLGDTMSSGQRRERDSRGVHKTTLRRYNTPYFDPARSRNQECIRTFEVRCPINVTGGFNFPGRRDKATYLNDSYNLVDDLTPCAAVIQFGIVHVQYWRGHVLSSSRAAGT